MHYRLQRVNGFRLWIFSLNKPDELSGVLTATVNNQHWPSTVVNGHSENASLMNLNRELAVGGDDVIMHLYRTPDISNIYSWSFGLRYNEVRL